MVSQRSINVQDGIAGTEVRTLVVAFPRRESCSRALKCLVVAEIN
jgi:hypothetical protein